MSWKILNIQVSKITIFQCTCLINRRADRQAYKLLGRLRPRNRNLENTFLSLATSQNSLLLLLVTHFYAPIRALHSLCLLLSVHRAVFVGGSLMIKVYIHTVEKNMMLKIS